MKFVVAMLRHETNTFSPVPTPLAAFGRGDDGGPKAGARAIATFGGTNCPAAAFLDIAAATGAEVDFPVAANAAPSGPVEAEAFETMAGAIVDAVSRGCDAVLLDLHGAMVCQDFDDGEGELLRRIRAVAPDVPMAVALDFHTNMTAAMVDNATVVTGYRTYPHVDMHETGMRAGLILLRALKGEVRPRMVWRSLPMLTHMLRQTPAEQPMKDIMDGAIAAEAAGTVLAASVFGGFPLADIPHVGLSLVCVGDGDVGAAQGLTESLAGLAWERRADFVFDAEPMAQSIARARDLAEGPVVLADHGDNAGAGGPQDNMEALRQVMAQGLEDVAAGPFFDPQTASTLAQAGIGAEVTVEIGGRTHTPAMGLEGRPLEVTGRVRRLTDGRFRVTGPMSTGSMINMGLSAVLDTGSVEIVVSTNRNEPYDTGCFTHAGIDPARKHYVLIKSRQHFRAGFEPIARHIVLVAGPGVCSSDYGLFPFKNLRRPIYPLDLETAP
jgi:microcystin degradation protein MlrC